MSDILQEIEDEKNYTNKVKLFKTILITSILVSIVAIAAYSVYLFQHNKQMELNAQIGEILINFEQDPSQENFQRLSQSLESQDTAFSNFAKLDLVGHSLKNNDYNEASEYLQQIINSKNTNYIIRAHAIINLASIALDHDQVIDDSLLQKYLDEIQNNKSPLNASAKLMKALHLVKKDQKDPATKLLQSILDSTDIAQVIKTQAQAVLNSITIYKE